MFKYFYAKNVIDWLITIKIGIHYFSEWTVFLLGSLNNELSVVTMWKLL